MRALRDRDRLLAACAVFVRVGDSRAVPLRLRRRLGGRRLCGPAWRRGSLLLLLRGALGDRLRAPLATRLRLDRDLLRLARLARGLRRTGYYLDVRFSPRITPVRVKHPIKDDGTVPTTRTLCGSPKHAPSCKASRLRRSHPLSNWNGTFQRTPHATAASALLGLLATATTGATGGDGEDEEDEDEGGLAAGGIPTTTLVRAFIHPKKNAKRETVVSSCVLTREYIYIYIY